MKRTGIIKARASEYEKAVLKALVEQANRETDALSESDIIRIAIMDMAKRYISPADLQAIKSEYENRI